MSADHEPTAPNPAHGLGPHVVGSRIVVRRVLRGETGPSGGPAMTDLLGICEAWDGEACVVRPEGGAPVRIALRDIVSGKPVPPRASVRDRVPARDAQVHGFALFPDLVTEPLGAWILRDSATATARRANSVLAFGPSGLDDEAAVAAVRAHYERPVAAVRAGSEEETLFTARGWVPESTDADTLFQVTGVAQLSRALRRVGADEADLVVEDRARAGSATATARLDQRASGVAGYADDWLGFRSIQVEPTHRRRGHGLAVMSALTTWGAEQGALTAYLQVLADNAPALALYERLGFRTHHRYRYLTPPA
ncbi:GNAT family N-acetyltransferase [Nocardioides sp. GXZ039]|uniref:GNAT family N-acetyltransferase n=1 Tax=Nocardioides sp. GXZ039 TaxID=3136018 RepID=UPI0030F4803B